MPLRKLNVFIRWYYHPLNAPTCGSAQSGTAEDVDQLKTRISYRRESATDVDQLQTWISYRRGSAKAVDQQDVDQQRLKSEDTATSLYHYFDNIL
ncbi:hypothetical protein LRAMOSA09419 [Lichtheimia ramosa]|uniref:Uncharacterized protein n=1 Tax=Lichtheimia ramosa TaxID=688394 RepID=A0A077WGV1_9FUNG|nr:hypothetical protein LRAMOSA09419 [Lichtheimia ramosa]